MLLESRTSVPVDEPDDEIAAYGQYLEEWAASSDAPAWFEPLLQSYIAADNLFTEGHILSDVRSFARVNHERIWEPSES